ncbi:bindin-like [Lytechinus variegatus]|uniref:bindin-like n=1 Tax=Lytechinus variegatus TaxID=7654 RepID=UPI001BB20D0D|nr:bindin-like [Lytechinus variegatus]
MARQLSVILVALTLTTALAENFPTRTSAPSDCPQADQGCWCHKNFAQCWRTYDDSRLTEEIGSRITRLELLYQPNEEVVTYIRRMSALREIRISEDGMSLDCSCDLVDAMDDKGITLVNQDELEIRNCRQQGWSRDTMTARPFLIDCRRFRIQDDDRRKRREAEQDSDDVTKRASPRKGDKPAGHKLKDLAPKDTHHLVSIDDVEKHPATDFFNFISGHRRTRRSTGTNEEVSDDSGRSARKKRYGNMNYPQPMNQPMGGGNYPGQPPQQNYAPQGMGGPVGGVGMGGAVGAGAMGGPVGGGGGGGMGGPVGGANGIGESVEDEMSVDSDYSSLGGETTISAKVMQDIKAVLGATKIDLPVDINDPYDLGLLLRHLRHHSNLLANIGDPEVREQVLSAMQEEEEEEENDAANGVRENVLNNLNAPGQGGYGGTQGGMRGGAGGGMMGNQGMGGQGYNQGYMQG